MSTEYRIADLNQLAVVLRSFRRARKLTQVQLAERLGIAQQSYARMESQPAATSVSNLMKMLGVLGVDLVLRDRTSATKIEQAVQAGLKKTSSTPKQTQNASAKPMKSAEGTPKKPARHLSAASATLKVKSGDAQMRTGKVLPLTTKKGW